MNGIVVRPMLLNGSGGWTQHFQECKGLGLPDTTQFVKIKREDAEQDAPVHPPTQRPQCRYCLTWGVQEVSSWD